MKPKKGPCIPRFHEVQTDRVLALLMLTTMASTALAGTAEPGEDVNPDDSVPFTVLERTAPSQDGAEWELSLH